MREQRVKTVVGRIRRNYTGEVRDFKISPDEWDPLGGFGELDDVRALATGRVCDHVRAVAYQKPVRRLAYPELPNAPELPDVDPGHTVETCQGRFQVLRLIAILEDGTEVTLV